LGSVFLGTPPNRHIAALSCPPMRISAVWLIAALVVVLLALLLTALLPGGRETASETQPGPFVESPSPAGG